MWHIYPQKRSSRTCVDERYVSIYHVLVCLSNFAIFRRKQDAQKFVVSMRKSWLQTCNVQVVFAHWLA